MAHFHILCHGNCALGYVGHIPELRKLDFRRLKCQFGEEKSNFRGLIAKISHYRPILASGTPPWPIFITYYVGIVP